MKTSPVSQLSSLPASGFKQTDQAQVDFESTSAAFLYAWKQGVALAGPTYFGDCTKNSVENAKCRWDLRPDLLMINHSFHVLSTNERIFLAAMVSFYDTYEGSALFKHVGFLGFANLGPLDQARRDVIASLIMHFHSW
ncbi:hypothetical protein ABH912_000547 [Pseudomonas sp. BT76 TE3572]|uniref:hypothetical protein n=1 Tax=Pseudomonas sp. BT76 TE3572 TaxID=3349325 RepID=UPI003D1A1F07